MPLPIGFFMPLPLPIMIPFMMWQSAAIAAGFGTYFQFAKRRVSAMSNEEFNNSDPHQLVNSMYEDIVKQIPSSFAKVDSLTPVMLQSMNVMLDQAVKWLQGAITGNFFGTPNPVNADGTPDVFDTTPAIDTGLTLDSATILAWSAARLAQEHFKITQGTSTYNQATQNIIITLWDTRQREGELPETDVSGPSLTKFGHIIITNELNKWHSLFTERLNDAPSAFEWASIANTMFDSVAKSLFTSGMSQATRNRLEAAEIVRRDKKIQIVAVILKQNNANIPNT